MSSSLAPIIQTFKAGGTIVKGHAVKIGSARDTVVECTGLTDKAIGVAQVAASSGGLVEVAMPGGGCKALAGGTISAGMLCGSHTDGSIKKMATAGDRVLLVALEDAVSGDMFGGIVQLGQAYQTES